MQRANRIASILNRSVLALASCAALCAYTGCGAASSGKVAVSGEVRYDGEPLSNGQVVLEPRGVGRMAIGQIVGGRYLIAAERGPTAGDYVVRITASRPTGKMASSGSMSAGEMREVFEQFLPANYNESSELSLKIDATADVVHDFDLRSR